MVQSVHLDRLVHNASTYSCIVRHDPIWYALNSLSSLIRIYRLPYWPTPDSNLAEHPLRYKRPTSHPASLSYSHPPYSVTHTPHVRLAWGLGSPMG